MPSPSTETEETTAAAAKQRRVAEDNEFRERVLERHNALRKLHGAPALTLSDALSTEAQEWAEKIARKRHMSYCELPGVGENITFFPLALAPDAIVDYWYAENKKYEYCTPGWQPGCNYFTQIVWNATREAGAYLLNHLKKLGVGRARVAAPTTTIALSSSSSLIAAESTTTPPQQQRRVDANGGDATAAATHTNAIANDSANRPTTPEATAQHEQVVVCFYRPAGNNNRAGQFALNVFRPPKSAVPADVT